MKAGTAFRDDRVLRERRKIGAFYTPESLSQILSDWAIQSPDDTVLEPSFGGCGFLQSARKRLEHLGCAVARDRIYGCDIDPFAFGYLAEIFDGPVDLKRFLMADFLSINPGGTWPERFSAVLANPPYIPYQELGDERRTNLSSMPFQIPGVRGRASLWAYFVAHAMSFLDYGGRMAWVLPGAFLQADYAKPIREFFAISFRRVAAMVVHERVFKDVGTDEETVVLFADGFRAPPLRARIELREVTTLNELSEVVREWDAGTWVGNSATCRPAVLGLDGEARDSIAELENMPETQRLGDLASVQIGLVTGANDFFVLSRDAITAAGLEAADCKPVLAKFQASRGLRFLFGDHASFVSAGGRGYLIDHDGQAPNARLAAYLDTFPAHRIAGTSTFKKRKSWSKPDDGRVPDAFFPVMHHLGPRLLLNPCGFTCTNSIHRVYFKDGLSERRRMLVAISLLTTFSQLSAETVGRRYGSGVLKHEPRDAEAVRVLLPSISDDLLDQAAAKIDSSLNANDQAGAMRLADEIIYAASGIDDWAVTSDCLTSALHHLRLRRRPLAAQIGINSGRLMDLRHHGE